MRQGIVRGPRLQHQYRIHESRRRRLQAQVSGVPDRQLLGFGVSRGRVRHRQRRGARGERQLFHLSFDRLPQAVYRFQQDRERGFDAGVCRRQQQQRGQGHGPDQKTMVWGSLTGVDRRQWFWCKNISGYTFDGDGHERVLFRVEVRQHHQHDKHVARRRGVPVQELRHITVCDSRHRSTTHSLMSSNAQTAGTPVGYQNFKLGGTSSVTSTYAAAIPTYSVIESSSVRIQLQLNERAIGAASRIGDAHHALDHLPHGANLPVGQRARCQQHDNKGLCRLRFPEIGHEHDVHDK